MQHDAPPPGEIRKACSLKERASEMKAKHNIHGLTVRTTLDQAHEMGRELLDIKEQCIQEYKPWHEWLKEAGFKPDQAANYMRIATYWTKLVAHPEFSKYTGVAEALIIIAKIRQTEADKSVASNGTNDQPTIFCRQCRINGPVKNCKDCAAMRAEREPGEPTQEELEEEQAEKEEEKSKPKVGGELFVWRKFDDEYGKVVRFVDQFGNAYKVKEDPATEELRKLLNEFHKCFKKLYAKVAKQKAPAE